MIKVHIKASKTDPFRDCVDIYRGRAGGLLCPLVAMLSYLVKRGTGPGLLFYFADGRPLTRTRMKENVGNAPKASIDSSQYTGHSFRISAATTTAKEGIGDATIKILRRWRSSAYACC